VQITRIYRGAGRRIPSNNQSSSVAGPARRGRPRRRRGNQSAPFHYVVFQGQIHRRKRLVTWSDQPL